MQNKENGFGRFVKEKGYYIVLLLCAVAIGVSGSGRDGRAIMRRRAAVPFTGTPVSRMERTEHLFNRDV